MPDTHLILHVKGTEQDTTTLPKQVVRAAISQGQITHSQLIWVPEENNWKQVRQLPHLLPSQKLAPAPVRVPTGPLPKSAAVVVPKVHSGTIPRIAKASTPIPQVVVKAASASPTPRVAATAKVAVAATAQPAQSYVVKEENPGTHPLKWISIGLAVIIFGLVAINYFLVDRPLVSSLGQTSFSNVAVYAHLGAYVQPNVIVIHVPSSSGVTKDKLTDFLVALAHSTPSIPLSENTFARVALTSGWTADYTMTGYAWKQLGEMGKDDEAQRKEFLLDQLTDAVGEPLISTANKDDATLQAEREKTWDAFAAQFAKP
jgi:hypothetical protein